MQLEVVTGTERVPLSGVASVKTRKALGVSEFAGEPGGVECDIFILLHST